jgi:hypothetical protein
MTTLQAFLLGIMVAWTPSLILMLFLCRRAPFSDLEDRQNGVSDTCGLIGPPLREAWY